MITHVVEMLQEMRHISVQSIRRLINFIRLFRLLLDMFPEAEKELEQKVEFFVKNPEKRTKDYYSSLGDLLSLVTLSKNYKFKDILNAYIDEQMDRQVFWILREIPELDHEDPKYKGKDVITEDQRSEVSFKSGIVGFHVALFYSTLNQSILEAGESKDFNKICKQLDDNYGCLPDKLEVTFQKKCQEI